MPFVILGYVLLGIVALGVVALWGVTKAAPVPRVVSPKCAG